jgi:hypothetical protein
MVAKDKWFVPEFFFLNKDGSFSCRTLDIYQESLFGLALEVLISEFLSNYLQHCNKLCYCQEQQPIFLGIFIHDATCNYLERDKVWERIS